MRRVHDVVEGEVRPTTSGQLDLLAFVWRGERFVIVDRVRVWRSSPPGQRVHQRVATAGGLVFELHVEPAGRWVLDAVPDLLASPSDEGNSGR